MFFKKPKPTNFAVPNTPHLLINILYLKGDFNSTKKVQKGLLGAIYEHYAKILTILSVCIRMIFRAKIA